MNNPVFLFTTFAVVMLASCGENTTPTGETLVSVEDPEKINELVNEQLSAQLSKVDVAKTWTFQNDTITAVPQVKSFYTANGNSQAWFNGGKLNAVGDSMLNLIHDAEYFGLIPEDYHVALIDSFLSTSFDSATQSYNINQVANADVLISDAYFAMAVHASVGRIENDSSTARVLKIAKMDSTVNLVSTLVDARKNSQLRKSIEALEPQRREYQSVKRYMNAYRASMKGVVWSHLPDRKTDSIGFFKAIDVRLKQTHDWDTTIVGNDSLRRATALKKFQKRYFLEQDGKIGRNTILALNMTPDDWYRQMAMNMERWRWEPESFEKRHMIVNLPAYKMTVWEEDTIVMESKIVCGAVKTQTPELDSKMNQIVLYPYWTVPYTIAWKEILPHVKKDSSYLRKNRYEVLDRNKKVIDPKTINWSKYGKGNLPYQFRQMTGDDNALGIMKFEFYNPYAVYMHDTNAKKYFKTETRAYSHGCMRLEKYMELAHFLLRDDSVKYPKDTFDVWVQQDTQRRINLRKPLPIHVRYFTCAVDTDGVVELHTDIYLRDERMMKVLYNSTAPVSPAEKVPATQSTGNTNDKKAVLVRKPHLKTA
jgi:murein L,D-transpeptidase YcbB/YkuD